MKNNRLPLYWAVKNDGTELFKDTVVKYLNSISDIPYYGETYDSYYGMNLANDGKTIKPFVRRKLSNFRIFPVVLTIQRFIELTTEEKRPTIGAPVHIDETEEIYFFVSKYQDKYMVANEDFSKQFIFNKYVFDIDLIIANTIRPVIAKSNLELAKEKYLNKEVVLLQGSRSKHIVKELIEKEDGEILVNIGTSHDSLYKTSEVSLIKS